MSLPIKSQDKNGTIIQLKLGCTISIEHALSSARAKTSKIHFSVSLFSAFLTINGVENKLPSCLSSFT